MLKIHWLDLNHMEGREPVTVFVDSNWDWRRRSHARFQTCEFEQISPLTQLLIEVADPFWAMPRWDFSLARSPCAIATQPTLFGTQLPESLFWCGWDQFGEFDTGSGWDAGFWQMGGWPASLSAKPSWITLIPVHSDVLDLRWFITAHQQYLAPIAIGPGVDSVYHSLGLDYPAVLTSAKEDLNTWHDLVWGFSETVQWEDYGGVWQSNFRNLITQVLDRNQLSEFNDVPAWARNTHRLCSTLQRGQARLRQVLSWLDCVV